LFDDTGNWACEDTEDSDDFEDGVWDLSCDFRRESIDDSSDMSREYL